MCRAARAVLEGEWYDERDLMDAAITSIDQGSAVLPDLGAIVVYLPQDISPPGARLLRTLAAHTVVTVVAGVTGVARADTGVATAVERLGSTVAVAGGGGDAVTPPHATDVVSASDPDDEVRAAVRLVMAALVDGVALERMAILYGAPEPYARLVHEQLDAADIPHNGAAVRTLAESVLGRSLLSLLRLPERDFHRHDVMALLASAPLWHEGQPVPAARWERISRRAGIVRGAGQWHERLERHATALEAELAKELAVPDREPRPDWYEHELAATRELDAFVASLRDALRDGTRAGAGWRDLSVWARGLVHTFLARDTRRTAWPEPEQDAADKVEAALERLAGLDAVEPEPGIEVFLRTLELELDADLGRVGRLGEGILMGHVALGLGLDLDRVFVCGMTEGTFPARVRDDSLLPDVDRRVTERRAGVARGTGRRRPPHAAGRARVVRRPARAAVPARRPAPHDRPHAVAVPARLRGGTRRRAPLRRRPRRTRSRLVPRGALVRGRDRTSRFPRDRAGAPAARAPRPHRARSGRGKRTARARRRARPRARVRARARGHVLHEVRRQPRHSRRRAA